MEAFNEIQKAQHYNSHPSGLEIIDLIKYLSFPLGNAIKYLWRCEHKGTYLKDLEKALYYLNAIRKFGIEEMHLENIVDFTNDYIEYSTKADLNDSEKILEALMVAIRKFAFSHMTFDEGYETLCLAIHHILIPKLSELIKASS